MIRKRAFRTASTDTQVIRKNENGIYSEIGAGIGKSSC